MNCYFSIYNFQLILRYSIITINKRIMFCFSVPLRPEAEIINNIQDCKEHHMKTQFMCLQSTCERNCLLCIHCMASSHRNHNWISMKDFIDDDLRQMLQTGTSRIGQQIRVVALGLLDRYTAFHDRIHNKLQLIERQLQKQMQSLQKQYPVNGRFGLQGLSLDCSNAIKLKNIKMRQQRTDWVITMQKLVHKTLTETENSIYNILEDLDIIYQTQQWDLFQKNAEEQIVQQFIQHLHPHPIIDPNYFKFSQEWRVPGIVLSEDRLRCIFLSCIPNRVSAIIEKPFTVQHPKLAFKIVDETKNFLVLSNVLICLGVCIPSIVKSKGFRHQYLPGNGAFMIGNSGWTYHHSYAQYNRQAVVGWTFGRGDIIDVQVELKDKGRIKFSRRGYFKKYFEMQLGVKPQQINHLHPIVYFDGNVGSRIEIINE